MSAVISDRPTREIQRTALRAILALLTLLLLGSCATARSPQPARPAPTQPVGYSGMALIEPNRYLVVHDAKVYEDRPRLGILSITALGPLYAPLTIADWMDPDGRSNDLESACALANRSGEFLVAESGYWERKYGRLFHVRVSGQTGSVMRAYKLPLLADNDETKTGDNFEGLACTRQADGRYLLLLGERGGSDLYPAGRLRWGWLDLPATSVEWAEMGKASIEVTAPGRWAMTKRDIADLYLDPEGTLWATATADESDNGPFRSVVFRIGRFTTGLATPVTLAVPLVADWTIDAMKVEALAAPATAVPGSVLSIGTDDENFGGVWRALFPPVTGGSP